MKTSLITYRIQTHKVLENEALIRAVFQQLQEQQPEGVSYSVYQNGEDGFVHLVVFDDEAAQQAFISLPAFKHFQAEMKQRLAAPPVVTQLKQLVSYGKLGSVRQGSVAER
jgi:quinol monooxygenase YgiN